MTSLVTLHNIKVIFLRYQEGFNFETGKVSEILKDEHVTIPKKAPSITSYTKADICNGYVIPQETRVYRKSGKYELFRKQNWFGDVQPNERTGLND